MIQRIRSAGRRPRIIAIGAVLVLLIGGVWWWSRDTRIVAETVDEYLDLITCPDWTDITPTLSGEQPETTFVAIFEVQLENLLAVKPPPVLKKAHEASIESTRARLSYAYADTSGDALNWLFIPDADDAARDAWAALPQETLDYIEEYCAPRRALQQEKMDALRESEEPEDDFHF